MFKIGGTVASQTKQLEAHCDFKLKKPKAASGILMIRQNSFHEIPSLLCLDYILISLLHQTNTNIPSLLLISRLYPHPIIAKNSDFI